MPSFGENLKQLRAQRKISQGELAGMIKMHPTHISRYERNQASPTVEVVRKIAEALQVSADELIYGDSKDMASEKINDKELLQMFSQVQKLNTDDVHCVKSLLGAYLIKSDLQQKLTVK
ncbi:helix-turn-helix domain-containing protein [Halocola ammonii]